MQDTMRAALFDRYGGPEELYIGEVPVPVPGGTQALIRVAASSINGGEITGRRGELRLLTGGRFPRRTGIDFVGTVVEAGTALPSSATGSRVWGTVEARGRQGALAELIAVEASRFAVAPAGLSAVEAVSLVAGGTTALRGLRDEARIRPGERLLVRGAAGGVGSVAVQIGKHLGARVTALAAPRTADFVRSLGADEVLDYSTPPELLGRYDVVFDTRGTDHRSYRRLLVPGGRMVTIAFDLRRPLRSLAYLQVVRFDRARSLRLFLGDPTRPLLEELTALAESGAVRPVVDVELPFEEVATAHARLEQGGVRGKVVVRVGD